MQLTSHIEGINFSNEIVSLNQIFQNSHAKVTLSGQRKIKIDGYLGSVSLETFAQKLSDASTQCSTDDNWSPEKRIAGVELTNRLVTFYQETDDLIKQKNVCTRLMNTIRELHVFPYTPRFFAENENINHNFRAYSEMKFVREFGGYPNSYGIYSNSDGAFGPPSRIIAREKDIRKKGNLPIPPSKDVEISVDRRLIPRANFH